MEPPFRRRGTNARSRASESKAAAQEGGRRVPLSGAGRQKGDVKLNKFRVEDKFTDAASYSLKLADLLKIERHAIRTPPCLMPQMRITIQGKSFRLMREEDYLALGLNKMDA